MFIMNMRQGIGFDIEFNEDICHIVDDGSDKHKIVAFQGIVIMIPFVRIYFGNFEEIGREQ